MKVIDSNGHAVATLMVTSKAYTTRTEMARMTVNLAALPNLIDALLHIHDLALAANKPSIAAVARDALDPIVTV